MAVEVLFVPPKKSVARARSCVSGTLEKKNRTAIRALICRLATNFWKNNGTRAIFFERARKRLYNGAQPEGELARTFCMEKGKKFEKVLGYSSLRYARRDDIMVGRGQSIGLCPLTCRNCFLYGS